MCVFPLFFAGCAERSDAPLVSGESMTGEPFAVDIAEELNDGERLSVFVRVRVRAGSATSGASVHLQTFNNGTVVGQQSTPLDDVLPRADQGPLASRDGFVMMTAPARHATDYQVELSWGSQVTATPRRPIAEVDQSAPPVVVTNPEVGSTQHQCSAPPCPITYVMRGKLENRHKNQMVVAVTLAVGYLERARYGQTLDKQQVIPQNEQFVTLENLNLEAGGSRPLELALGEPLPAEIAEQLIPVLRVVQAQFK